MPSFQPRADLIATSSVRFEGDRSFVPGASTKDMRHGAVLWSKAYPPATGPGIFGQFDLGLDGVVTPSFTPIDQVAALARIKRTMRRLGAADDAAASLRAELVDVARDLASCRPRRAPRDRRALRPRSGPARRGGGAGPGGSAARRLRDSA